MQKIVVFLLSIALLGIILFTIVPIVADLPTNINSGNISYLSFNPNPTITYKVFTNFSDVSIELNTTLSGTLLQGMTTNSLNLSITPINGNELRVNDYNLTQSHTAVNYLISAVTIYDILFSYVELNSSKKGYLNNIDENLFFYPSNIKHPFVGFTYNTNGYSSGQSKIIGFIPLDNEVAYISVYLDFSGNFTLSKYVNGTEYDVSSINFDVGTTGINTFPVIQPVSLVLNIGSIFFVAFLIILVYIPFHERINKKVVILIKNMRLKQNDKE